MWEQVLPFKGTVTIHRQGRSSNRAWSGEDTDGVISLGWGQVAEIGGA